MKDIGILASDDPVAIDQACLDLVYAAKDDPGRDHLIERIGVPPTAYTPSSVLLHWAAVPESTNSSN